MTETIGAPGSSPTEVVRAAGHQGSPGALGPVCDNGGPAACGSSGCSPPPGVHPYDEVTWQRRDVVMTNWRDGTVNFEQRGVEFPESWSVNATNIVTSKYFRGAVGTPARESSLRQIIDRVVGKYTAAGVEHGYFATDEDEEIFAHELTWMLLHQVFAFNSPVWFNVGTSSPQQVSACFILSVDDTMDAILNWYREEGLIFKGGSGAGLNLSRIRSSKELLSSGGTASGPVSFMRGADASAGTIKSGGATRRAAKMVVLDVDHPDIAEFVETKAKEEHKIRVLRDAGFDMDLGGDDIISVQYQNANNSVRVSDEFMRAVDAGDEFGLRARQTGEVIETVDARELFGKITQAAWDCADPGIQYDDTINDWHTSPESGRINASNPCSEYMHLDNSSCNLASLNLMKFLSDDGVFDAATFAKAVEFVITAMDISICFADFPTQPIAETTRAFRQLGVGYANLGALLMATGHAYDSEGGRSLAAAITSLMNGVAYKRSAELAGVVGPYDGYARNVDAHKRVIRKHAAANDYIRAVGGNDAATLKLATQVWAETIATGEKNGYRNAQASVLAPTGTIGLMMDCDTTGIEPDLALVKFKKLVGGGSMQIVNQTVPQALRSLGLPGGVDRGDRRVHRRARSCHRRAGAQAGALRGVRLRDGRPFDRPDGSRADDGRGAAVHLRGHLQDGQHAGERHASPTSPRSTSRAGRWASRRWPSTGTTARSGSRCPPRTRTTARSRPMLRRRSGRGGSAGAGRHRPGAAPAAEEASVADGVVHRRRCRGLPDHRFLPGRRPRRGVHQARQAGLHPGRRDGRVLHRGVGRAAVRDPAGVLRREVHQPALRAGRDDRRPGRPDRHLGDGLPVPPDRAGLPAGRCPGRARDLLRRGAGGSGVGQLRRRRECFGRSACRRGPADDGGRHPGGSAGRRVRNAGCRGRRSRRPAAPVGPVRRSSCWRW